MIKYIPDFPGYLAYSSGKIFSLKTQRFLRPGITNGYAYVVLRQKGQSKMLAVHRLICELFNGKPPFENAVVNHKDGNKVHNTPGNLEWATSKENNQHAQEMGLTPVLADFNIERRRAVIGLCKKTNTILYRFESVREAERNGHKADRIHKCLQDPSKTHHGCFWRDA